MSATADGEGRLSYEQAVRVLRAQPQCADLVREAYLGENALEAAERFASGEEWAETARLLGLDRARPLRVLDLGCGNGIASYALARLAQRVVSVDPDTSDDTGLRAASRISQAASQRSARAVQARAELLPFASGSFDRVYARQALHHFSDLRGALAECRRVLRPGGLLLAAREHVVSDDDELRRFLDAHPLHGLHGGENAYAVGAYVAALEAAGLDVLRVLGPFDSPVNTHPTSSEQIDGWLEDALARRTGRAAAHVLARLAPLRRMYRARLSRRCTYPGRLYSFLCTRGSA